MRILVTGASGRIGSEVCKALPTSVDVWEAWRRLPSDADRKVQVDLTDPTATRTALEKVNPDVVVHLAGSAGNDERSLFDSNVRATENLVQSVDNRTHVVVAGSAAEYGSPTRPLTHEDDPLTPVTAYGQSKAAQTKLARIVGDQRDLRVTIARPFNVVSGDMPRTSALGSIAHQIRTHSGSEGLTLTVGRLDIIRDFVPLSFVAEAFVSIALAEITEDTYNICSGHGFELSEIVDAMANRMNLEIDVRINPELAAIPAADVIVGDPGRLTRLMGWGWNPSVDGLASVALGTRTSDSETVPFTDSSPETQDFHERAD